MPDDGHAQPARPAPNGPDPHGSPAPTATTGEAETDDDFAEAAYLAAFPDVAQAVRRGQISSAREHYRRAGRTERRLERPEYQRHVAQLRGTPDPALLPGTHSDTPAVSVEAITLSHTGGLFITGWTDDRQRPLTAISARMGHGLHWRWTSFPRVRRLDVEAVVPTPRPYRYGFWAVGRGEAMAQPQLHAADDCMVELQFAGGTTIQVTRSPDVCADVELRDSAMDYLANAPSCGNRVAETFANLDRHAGDWLSGFSRGISRGIVGGAAVARFGPQRARYRGSIIVPLYGIGDYLFVQGCTYAQRRGIADYEFIYVINSPELAERLHREARISEMIYGLSLSLVTLPDNAGFGAASNLGVQFARSERVLFVNPDVFPRDPDWAQRHTDLVRTLPEEQTRLFGTSLFYDDGSLMHGGMYFEADSGILPGEARVTQRPMLRVEHYGKGAPPWAAQYVAARAVPAVTGAFMSADRAWFERLGGFTEDYVFGHYEDADLCLKSLRAGTPVWLHDIPMWHLEAKGSRRLPRHEGGSLLNRWLFTRTWAPLIVPDLLGRTPRLRLGRAADPAAGSSQPARRGAAQPVRSTARVRRPRLRSV